MRVLQVQNRALTAGGVDAIVETERAFLRSSGHEVGQLFLDTADVLAQSKVRAGLKGVWNVAFARQLDSTILEMKPDVVHFQTPFPVMSPAVFRISSKRSVPTVASIHSYRYSCIQGQFYRDGKVCELCLGKKLKLSGLRYRCYHDSLLGSSSLTASLALHKGLGTFSDDVDRWIVNTPFVKRKLGEEGIRSEKIVVKPNAMADPGQQSAPTGSSAIYLGRLEPEKGVAVMLDAWATMADPPPLTIMGDGSLRDLVERATRSNDRINFRGWVDQAELRIALAEARFLILPSQWYEGQPIVAIQSLAAGTPIIASDVGNFTDMIEPDSNGYLFQSGSSRSLAAVVETAWSQTDRYEALRRGARATYEHGHTESHSGNILLSAYREAVLERTNSASGG